MVIFRLFSRLRLRAKFSLVMFWLVIAIIGVVLSLLYSQQKAAIWAEVRERAIDLATILAFAGVRASLENDYLVLQELVDSISNREDVEQVMVLSPEGKVLVHNYTGERGKIYQGHPRRSADGSNDPVVVTNKVNDENFLDVTTPIILAGEPKAYSRVILSLKTADLAIRKMWRDIVLLGLLSGIIALLLAAFLSGLVIKPLQRLYREAQQIRRGSREIQIEVTAQDEIGTLQQALKTMVEEVRLRSRLAALGVTMANLSHEIKTPLAAITKYLTDAAGKNGEAESHTAKHAKVLGEVNRLNDLVKNLLMFSQNRRLVLSRTNINDLMDQALFILETPIKERRIAVTLKLETLPAFAADKNLLQSVFVNLISNAIEAMARDGALLIQTRFVTGQRAAFPEQLNSDGLPRLAPAPLAETDHASPRKKSWRRQVSKYMKRQGARFFIKQTAIDESSTPAAVAASNGPSSNPPPDWLQKLPLQPFPPDKDAIEVTIADNGHGIPEDLMDQLFLPFASRKSTGIGLGLALSHKVIEEHHGAIRVQSKVGKGTTFIITLPV